MRWLFGSRVDMAEPVRACIDCGLLWTEVPARQLEQILIDAGTAETKRRLGL